MTALAEALLAAQRQAIGALSKAYVAGTLDEDGVTTGLEAIGATDVTDRQHLLNALEILQNLGAPAPRATQPETKRDGTDLASDAQLTLLRKVADERGYVAPDYHLTKANASKVIDEMKAGTYNPDEWTVPF